MARRDHFFFVFGYLSVLRRELGSPFGVVVVTSLDDQPLASSKRWLLTALGNAVNTGMKLDPSGNRLADAGRAPVLVEPIVGKVTFKKLDGGGGGIRVHALDAAGGRGKEIAVSATPDGAVLELLAEHRTMHYEVSR